MATPQTILIIEPSDHLVQPYSYFHAYGKVVRVNSINYALEEIERDQPSLILLSASFTPERCVVVLEAVKKLCADTKKLIPVLMVVNLAQPVSYIPGTTWGGYFGIVHSQSTSAEVNSTLLRVMN